MVPRPPEVDLRSNMRNAFYIAMVQSEDDETQRKGVVGVAFQYHQEKQMDKQSEPNAWQSPRLFRAVPIRYVAVHLCHDSWLFWAPFIGLLKLILGLFTRVRLREHCGSHQECLISLQTYAIPTKKCFPMSCDGVILTEYHQEFWQKRRNLERMRRKQKSGRVEGDNFEQANDDAIEPITTPSQHDVLLGRGKRYYKHPGNIRFRFLVDERTQIYNTAKDAREKKRLTSEVVELVKQAGGHFLKDYIYAGWIQVENEIARLKVSHVFRNMRNRRTTSSSASNSGISSK